MTGRCEAEMCPNWTGDGCLCAVMDGDLDDPRAQQFLHSLDDFSCTDECADDCMADHRGES